MSAWDKPRDPARIPAVLEVIERLWKQYPDMRLGQLVENLATSRHPTYYVEDECLVENAHKVVGKGWPSLYEQPEATDA